MATEKNITMKQFNGTDYDTLYPKTIASQIPDVYSKTEVLTTETLSKYGLTADKLPNDVFQQIKTLIDTVQADVGGRAKIQTGSYIGTGTFGEGNPCSITFDFVPKLFWVPTKKYFTSTAKSIIATARYYANNTDLGLLYITGTDQCGYQGGQSGYLNTFVLNKKTLKWYTNGGDGSYQYNETNYTYYWIALG